MRSLRIYFTVTNDLTYDQRMIRICNSLATDGHIVTLVGRKQRTSVPITKATFNQRRLRCVFNSGFLFYAEYNMRLLLFLLFRNMDVVCAIDLDTIVPCYLTSSIKKIPRVYDAHELFCEMKEVVTRPFIYKCWKFIERHTVPKFRFGYTVNKLIAGEFKKMYGVDYEVIRNLPVLAPLPQVEKKEKYFLYQGAVNEGRCFETLLPAMKHVPAKLIICGEGNFMVQAQELVRKHELGEKVHFMGKLSPEALRQQTLNAFAGLTLFEKIGMSNFLSLGNRFFDYMHAGIPQLAVRYPLYEEINNEYGFALLIDDCTEQEISEGLNRLLNDADIYEELRQNAVSSREMLNWSLEEKKLIAFYRNI